MRGRPARRIAAVSASLGQHHSDVGADDRGFGRVALALERLGADLLLRADDPTEEFDHLVVGLEFHHLIQNSPHPGEDGVGTGHDRPAIARRCGPHRHGKAGKIVT
jgi:hypothetical protein